MALHRQAFDFEYLPTQVTFGRGCVTTLAERIADRELSRILVVCGTNVGANRAVIEPVKAALGDRLIEVFAETTPEKELGTVFEGIERMEAGSIDGIVALGSGSSINVARAMCLLAALDRPRADIVAEIRATGVLPSPDAATSITPNIVVPTTMAGADLTYDGGIAVGPDTSSPSMDADGARSGSMADPRLMPAVALYDPDLFATTPEAVLTASAMNGFDKGIETVYSRVSNPLSAAHALQGLRYLHRGLPGLRDVSLEDSSIDHAVIGMILVQYGRSTNLVHTFGNGVSSRYDVQQGVVHGIVVPHVLRYIFDRIDARRHLLAGALDVDPAGRTDAEIASAIIDEVVRLRDAIGLPAQLRSVAGLERDHLPAVATAIAENPKHARNPPGIDPTEAAILGILEAAW